MPIVPVISSTEGVEYNVSEESESDISERLEYLQSLHLILPTSMVRVKDVDIDGHTPSPRGGRSSERRGSSALSTANQKRRLRGYETLQELRDKAASFRQGYLNWRKFKPKGAKGETTDLFTGRKASETPARVEISILQKQASLAYPRESHQQKVLQPESSDQNVPPAAKLTTDSIAVKEGKQHWIDRVSKPMPPQQQTDVQGVLKTLDDEDEWLRFYYNPFTPAATTPAAPVRNATLSHLASRGVRVPTYNRDPATVTHWIMHIGVGQFHRSHQLVYMDDLLTIRGTKATDGRRGSGASVKSVTTGTTVTSSAMSPAASQSKWGYCGVGLMPFDSKMAQALRRQEFLYTVMARSNVSTSIRIIGSMFDYVFAYEEPDVAFRKLVDPRLHIVSMTITEKGYCQSVDGSLDLDNVLVQHDLELFKTSLHQETRLRGSPRTALGFLYWGLRERKRRGLEPFTIMSCDNLPENGHVAKHMVTAFSQRLDPEFATWIHENVQFPCSMVDRITPATVLEHREILAKDYGVSDEWPVVTEEFMQWAIEDNFRCRPPWENVGALLVSDVRPFELMKLRLLNGGHSMIGYISYLAGYQFVDDAVNDVKISSFLRAYMDEVTSTIRNVSIELERYKEKIVERFGNRMIKDRLLRLCEDGSTKLFNATKDALTELVIEERHIHCIALGLAAFILFLATSPRDIILDAKKDFVVQLATDAVDHIPNTAPIAEFLRNVYGNALGQAPCLVNHTCLALLALKHCTAEGVLSCGGTLEALFHRRICSPKAFSDFLTCVDMTTSGQA